MTPGDLASSLPRPGAARLGFESEEAEAADRQLIAIGKSAPFDDLAIEEDAVEAAVVEDTQRVGLLGDDQGVAARDAGVLETDIGADAASNPGPALGDREYLDLAVVIAQSDVAAWSFQHLSRRPQPVGGGDGIGERDFGSLPVVLSGLEDRVAQVLGGSAARTIGQLVALAQRKLRSA